MITTTPPSAARICRDCSNLVTTDATCPLCNEPTEEHPQKEDKEHYCVDCAEGPIQSSKMHLLTWNEDPYTQDDDGDLCCICEACLKRRNDESEAED